MKRNSENEIKQIVKEYYTRHDRVNLWSCSADTTPLAQAELEEVTGNFKVNLTPTASQTCLDVGAGGGRFALSLAAMGLKMVGVDFSPQMLKQIAGEAERRKIDVLLCQADAENLPFRSQAFDAVICMQTIQVCPNPDRVISEMGRVLDHNGTVMLSTINRFSLPALSTVPIQIYHLLSRTPITSRAFSGRQLKAFFHRAQVHMTNLHCRGLFGDGIAFPITRRLSIPIIPKPIAQWFFKKIEVKLPLGKTPLGIILHRLVFIGAKDSITPNRHKYDCKGEIK